MVPENSRVRIGLASVLVPTPTVCSWVRPVMLAQVRVMACAGLAPGAWSHQVPCPTTTTRREVPAGTARVGTEPVTAADEPGVLVFLSTTLRAIRLGRNTVVTVPPPGAFGPST